MSAVGRAAEEVARLLRACGDGWVDESGATRLLGCLAGGRLEAEGTIGPVRALQPERARLLRVTDPGAVHLRACRLHLGGVRIADTTAMVVTDLVTWPKVRQSLGILPGGGLDRDHPGLPLGRALAGCGVTREQGRVMVSPMPGPGPAVLSSALLRDLCGRPLAVVHEQIAAEWLVGLDPDWVISVGAAFSVRTLKGPAAAGKGAGKQR